MTSPSLRPGRRLAALVATFLCLGAGVAFAQAPPATVDAGRTADAAPTAGIPYDTAGIPSGTVRVFNRPIVVLRAPFMGISPRDRAAAATERIKQVLARGGPGEVSLIEAPQGIAVNLDGELVFLIGHDDARATPGERLQTMGDRAAAAMRTVVAETRESRNASFLTRALLHALAATAVWLVLMGLARLMWRATERWLVRLAHRQAERLRVGGGEVISREIAIASVRRLAAALAVFTMLLLSWEWLGYVLGLFPYTRPWSEGLTGFLIDTALGLLEAIAGSLPSLFVAILIFAIAWAVDRAQRQFFDRVATGRIEFGAIDRDAAPPTRRIASIAVWVFAAAMAYPYIPGSDTDAFKGLTVLLGLMVTVGASSIVGQAASGLILMYTRTYRNGDYVRIGDREGTVMRLGMFTTTVRTGLGEELTMPNAQVLGAVTTNYSRTPEGPGFVVSASVSIGYDAPWRQVHALLIEAARRTDGIEADPAPEVFQTALDDFYVKYSLVCRGTPTAPDLRAAVISALYASIQDAFNEQGVQIMSPHYLGDPAMPKIVPKARWNAPPAKPSS